MHRIDTATAVAAPPAVAAPGPMPNGYWVPGNPGGQPATGGDQDFFNMLQEELAAVLTGAGIAPVKGTYNQVLAALLKSFSPAIGSRWGVTGSAPGATVTASWTVPELVCKTALGGQPFLIANQVLNFNGSGVGIGGMDTGAVPAAGDLNFYAAFDPATGASGVFGTTACNGPIYTGAHAPAGFTATRLLSSAVTSGSAVPKFRQVNDTVLLDAPTIANGLTATAPTSLSLSVAVPACAKSILPFASLTGSSATNFYLAPDASTLDAGSSVGWGSNAVITSMAEMFLSTPQLAYYSTTSNSWSLLIAGYKI